jgi:serine acetyltransferase
LAFLVTDISRMINYFGFKGIKTLLLLLKAQFWVTVLIRIKISNSFLVLPFAILSDLILVTVFNLEVSRKCFIGPGLMLPHPRNIILGARHIGFNCTILANVTIGASSPDPKNNLSLRPYIGNDVLIGTGAVVLGDIVIEKGCIIGANATVVKSVEAGLKVVSKSITLKT